MESVRNAFVATPSDAVQFSASTATATETLNATTKVDLTVTRSGNTSGAASVNYASSDGTANERQTIWRRSARSASQAGETTKTISVFIVDDSYGESAETFNVTLSNPVGASLGAPATVTVTINSNEAVDGPNPVRDASFSSDFFVRQHYVDFFNREADAPGLAFWKNQIDECTTQACREIRRINVSAAFFLSIEFQQTGYLVYKAYQAAFNSGEQLRLQRLLAGYAGDWARRHHRPAGSRAAVRNEQAEFLPRLRATPGLPRRRGIPNNANGGAVRG